MPFDHCCLTHIPFENPYCDEKGNIFEYVAILKFIKHFKKNPITGAPLDAKSLIKLTFANNTNDDSEEICRYQCPALFKPFTKNSHIVAIKETGNVFSYEAVEQLNIKSKNWKDLINDTPFTRKDIITIQDPGQLEKFDISKFFYIKNNLRVETEEEIASRDPRQRIQKMSIETKEILDELETTYKAKEETIVERKVPDKFNAAHYSTGRVAASFTSTVMEIVRDNEADVLADDEVRYERIKKKGYVRITTNKGPLNVELFCDLVPKTCENFLKHCKNGYYNKTKFHRSIRNFMVQGGDPTSKHGKASGRGGTSIWGTKFEDEFKPNLSHSGRGMLSMANSGPNSNQSQFFITYRSCKHLDGKHTIFGKIVGGLDTLNEIERIEVDKYDAPIEDIIFEKCHVFVDPYEEVDEELAEARRLEAERIQKEKEELAAAKKAQSKPKALKVYREGVGKYLAKTATKASGSNEPPSKKQKSSYSFNFNNW